MSPIRDWFRRAEPTMKTIDVSVIEDVHKALDKNTRNKESSSGDSVSFGEASSSYSNYAVSIYRWWILTLFVLFSASNAMQWVQYTVIADIVMSYYEVSINAVTWTSLVYMVTYIPLIFPGSWVLDKWMKFELTPKIIH